MKYEIFTCPVCGGNSFSRYTTVGNMSEILCDTCGSAVELHIVMRRKLDCPVCGYHLVDAADDTTSQVRKVQKKDVWEPDYFCKCPRCKSDIGIKTVKNYNSTNS